MAPWDNTVEIGGIGDIIGRFSLLLVDVWGVLLDGGQAFPAATQAIVKAREAGLAVIIVTNSGTRANQVSQRLAKAGIPDEAHDGVISSGELTWRHLTGIERTRGADHPAIYHVTEGQGPLWLADLANPAADCVAAADMVLTTGVPYNIHGDAVYGLLDRIAEQGCERGLPLICADSDEVYPQNGRLRPGPGWLARLYKQRGGRVVEFGKPHDPIYDEALRIAEHTDPGRVLAIGDNLATDILGAHRRGFSSLLVLDQGVHKADTAATMAEISETTGAAPGFVSQHLKW